MPIPLRLLQSIVNQSLTEFFSREAAAILVKTILDDEMKVITITADLILHSRGESIAEDNLIAIEMKKCDRPATEKEADRDRLRAMTTSPYDQIYAYDGRETSPPLSVDAAFQHGVSSHHRYGGTLQALDAVRWGTDSVDGTQFIAITAGNTLYRLA